MGPGVAPHPSENHVPSAPCPLPPSYLGDLTVQGNCDLAWALPSQVACDQWQAPATELSGPVGTSRVMFHWR